MYFTTLRQGPIPTKIQGTIPTKSLEQDSESLLRENLAGDSKYQNLSRHPHATPSSVIPAKSLNGFHLLGAGLSIGITMMASKYFLSSEQQQQQQSSSLVSRFLKNSLLFAGVSLSVWTSFLLIRWNFFMWPKQVANEPLKMQRRTTTTTTVLQQLDPRLLLSATEIAQDLRDGKYTSVDICKAFIDHIERYDRDHINAVCYRRYGTALQEAHDADKKLKMWRDSGKSYSIPPFLGVPSSVKESFYIWDAPSTSNHPARIGNIIRKPSNETISSIQQKNQNQHRHHDETNNKNDDVDDDYLAEVALPYYQAPVVTRYKKVGFIFLCTTSVSELCMFIESYSVEELHGTTCNPYDSTRGVGGSTGGEAAAISSLFAPVGIGGDFGGSLRIPSFFNGIFTIKCSTRLILNQGQYPAPRTLGNLMTCTGPMVRRVEDLYPLLVVMQTGGNNLHHRQFDDDAGYQADQDQEHEYPFPISKEEKEFCERYPPSPQLPVHHHNHHHDEGATTTDLPEVVTLPPVVDPSKITLFVAEDLNIPFVTVTEEVRRGIRAVIEQYSKKHPECRILFVDLSSSPPTKEHSAEEIKNMKSGSTCTPKGWKNFSRAIDMWAECGAADPVDYVDFLKNRHYKPSGIDHRNHQPYKYSVFGEALKWLLGISNHTFPSIVLSLIETAHHTFISDDENGKIIELANQTSKMVGDDILGDNAVLICPTYPRVVPQHHSLRMLAVDFAYCALFNALQLPSAQVPIWLNEEDQKLPLGLQIISKWGNDILSVQMANEFAKKTDIVYHRVPEWMK